MNKRTSSHQQIQNLLKISPVLVKKASPSPKTVRPASESGKKIANFFAGIQRVCQETVYFSPECLPGW